MFPFLHLRGPLRDPDPEKQAGGGAPFDAEAFTRTLTQTLTSTLAEALKGFKPEPPDNPGKKEDPKPDPAKADPAKKDDPAPDWKTRELQDDVKRVRAQLDAEKTQRLASEKKAEEKDRRAQIVEKLSGFAFRTPEAQADVTESILRHVQRAKDGETLVGPDGEMPFSKFVDKQMEERYDYALKPLDTGGAGAQNSGHRGASVPQIENIRTGMKPEDLQRTREHIAAVARQAMLGQ